MSHNYKCRSALLGCRSICASDNKLSRIQIYVVSLTLWVLRFINRFKWCFFSRRGLAQSSYRRYQSEASFETRKVTSRLVTNQATWPKVSQSRVMMASHWRPCFVLHLLLTLYPIEPVKMCRIILLSILALIYPATCFQLVQFRSRQRLSTELYAAVKFRNFNEMLELFHDKPVLVSFHTRYCGPCKLMKKELRAVRDEMGDTVHLFGVDTEKFPSLSARYEVAGLPTLVLFYRGEIIYRVEGVEPAEKLVHRVRDLIWRCRGGMRTLTFLQRDGTNENYTAIWVLLLCTIWLITETIQQKIIVY